MKKLFAVILLLVTALAFAACGSYKVEGEKTAKDVYTCSDKNMLGLEKIVAFEDRIVMVFDRKAPTTGYELNVDQIMRSQSIKANVTISGVNNYQVTSKYEGNAEIFVVTIYVSGPDGDTRIINPVQGRSVSYIEIENYVVVINNGNMKISRSDVTDEGTVVHYQDYNQVSKKWSKIKQQKAKNSAAPAA